MAEVEDGEVDEIVEPFNFADEIVIESQRSKSDELVQPFDFGDGVVVQP